MTDQQWQAFREWDRTQVGGDVGTLDWPGFGPPAPADPPRPTYRKKPIPRGLRRRVLERDKYRCRKCGTHLNLCADHIIPESQGGKATLENLQTLCRSCNSRKGAR